MNKLTQISGVDNKIGRNSRTGSNITINVPDDLIMDVTQYYASVRANKEPTGRIKKIELVMYDESDLKEVVELPSTEELDKVTEETPVVEENTQSYQSDLKIFDDNKEEIQKGRLYDDNGNKL